jgi:hypothetical protein
MATTVATLIPRVRRFVGDYPELDTLTASVTSSSTLSVADTTIYARGWAIQVDQEAMLVKALTSATVLTTQRGHAGTTAASHVNSATVLIKPAFLDLEILDALNYALGNTFPYLYRPVLDTSLTTLASTYEYTVPNLGSVPIPYVSAVEVKESGDTAYRPVRAWEIQRGATPKIQFRRQQTAGGTIRVHGFGPFGRLAVTDSLDTQFPIDCEDLLVTGAGEYLLSSGEARRVRQDVGMPDQRENANRTGSSMQASNALLSRFERALLRKAMPPMPKHVQATF